MYQRAIHIEIGYTSVETNMYL